MWLVYCRSTSSSHTLQELLRLPLRMPEIAESIPTVCRILMGLDLSNKKSSFSELLSQSDTGAVCHSPYLTDTARESPAAAHARQHKEASFWKKLTLSRRVS
jgi:hypothetical protein